MTARPVVMWAPIIRTKGGVQWIFWDAIARTRCASREKFLDGSPVYRRAERLKGVRFARVQITELESGNAD